MPGPPPPPFPRNRESITPTPGTRGAGRHTRKCRNPPNQSPTSGASPPSYPRNRKSIVPTPNARGSPAAIPAKTGIHRPIPNVRWRRPPYLRKQESIAPTPNVLVAPTVIPAKAGIHPANSPVPRVTSRPLDPQTPHTPTEAKMPAYCRAIFTINTPNNATTGLPLLRQATTAICQWATPEAGPKLDASPAAAKGWPKKKGNWRKTTPACANQPASSPPASPRPPPPTRPPPQSRKR